MHERSTLRSVRIGPDAGIQSARRWGFYQAMLTAAGELGYANASVQDVIERSGMEHDEFERCFHGKEECFLAAYEAGIEYTFALVLAAALGAEPDRRSRLHAALARLFDLVTEQPAVARALFIEVHVVGGPALSKRKSMVERLARGLDSMRREVDPRHSSSPLTGTLIVGAIETVMCSQLREGKVADDLWPLLPELVDFGMLPYIGETTASAPREFELIDS